MTHEERDEAALGVALLRLAFIPIVIVGQGLTFGAPASRWFAPLLAPAIVYALGMLVCAAGGVGWRAASRLQPAVDLALLSGLALATGGGASELQKAFFVVPLAAALTARPRATMLCALGTVGGYAAVALGDPSLAESGDLSRRRDPRHLPRLGGGRRRLAVRRAQPAPRAHRDAARLARPARRPDA